MALTYPRDMPTSGIAGQSLEPRRVDFTSPAAGGGLGSIQAGLPRWAMSLSLGPMGEDDGDVWHAFMSALNGSARRFYAWDTSRLYPRAYPGGFGGMNRAGGGAFPADGAATSWSIAAGREALSLLGLPAGLALSLRDHIGFRWETEGEPRRAMVRVAEAVVASGGGTAVPTITPPLPSVVPADAVAYLYRPTVIMKQISEQSSLTERNANHETSGTFVALEDLRA